MMNVRNEPTAGPDQLAAAGRYVADRYGDPGVEMFVRNSLHSSRSYVVFEVHFANWGTDSISGAVWFLMDDACQIEPIDNDDADPVAMARSRLEEREALRILAPRCAVHAMPKPNLITNLLEAGRIVGLDPREMTAVALEELQKEQP